MFNVSNPSDPSSPRSEYHNSSPIFGKSLITVPFFKEILALVPEIIVTLELYTVSISVSMSR